MGAVGRRVEAPPHHVFTVVKDLAGGGDLQQIDAPEQGALAGAGGADDGGHVALFHGKIAIPQDLVGPEGLGQVVDL